MSKALKIIFITLIPIIIAVLTLTDKGTYTSNIVLQYFFSPAVTVDIKETSKSKNLKNYSLSVKHKSGENINNLKISLNVLGPDASIENISFLSGKIDSKYRTDESKTEILIVKSLLPQNGKISATFAVSGEGSVLEHNIFADSKLRIIDANNKGFKDSAIYKNIIPILLIAVAGFITLIALTAFVTFYLELLEKSGYYPDLKFSEVQEKLGKYDNIYYILFLFLIFVPFSLATSYEFSLFHIFGIYLITTRFKLIATKIDSWLEPEKDEKVTEKLISKKSKKA